MKMFRRLLLVCLLTAGLLTIGAPAFADSPPVTETNVAKTVETFVDVLPTCQGGGTLYTITTTSTSVDRTTIFDDGRRHGHFTDTGTFVAVPVDDPSLPSYTGKFQIAIDFNQNDTTVNFTVTFLNRGTGSDGSTFSSNEVDHFNVLPDGTVHEFFRCH
jgi:hypothetical protein